MKKSPTSLRLTILSLAAMILLGLLALDIINLRAENAERSRLLMLASETAQKEALAESILKLREEASREVEAFEKLTLSDDRLVPLIESIEGAGRALNLNLEITSVDKENGEGSAPQTIKIELEAVGSWSGVFSLLKAIESLPHRVMIEKVSLRKAEALWRADIALSLHSFD